MQEIANFKQFIFSLFTGHHKIFLSGSNSKLLSSELSTEFRGKTYEFQVQPLIAREVLSFYNLPRKEHYSTIELAEINRLYQKIFQYGSFPEIVMMDNNFTKQELLKSYFNILFFKDLIGRYHIENSAILRDLIKNLTLGFTKEVNITTTYKELKRQEIPVSPATLYEYYDNLKSTFYGHELTNFYSQH
ncbi:MAG: AAA family ATPase [Candidatus Peribacteria bacterium]|nr:AAA family ATPase [Candidatus Peribacteria bacterium]